jgi:hypothetical protein
MGTPHHGVRRLQKRRLAGHQLRRGGSGNRAQSCRRIHHQFPRPLLRQRTAWSNPGTFPSRSTIGTFTLSFGSYGGDRTGAVLLSPLLKPGSVSEIPFNHYSLLRTIEDIFDTDEHLGYAGQPGMQGFFGCVLSDISVKGEGRTCVSDKQ